MKKPSTPNKVPILGHANVEINRRNDRTAERIGGFVESQGVAAKRGGGNGKPATPSRAE